MPSRGSALALPSQTKPRKLARQTWSRLTRKDETGCHGRRVKTMTDTFAESRRATALRMAAILVVGAAVFDLVDGAVSGNPLLFIAGILFACSGVLLFDLRNQNPS
jgi:hypothetical protein